MTNVDYVKLIVLETNELEEAVSAYEKAKPERKYTYEYVDVPRCHSKEAVKRRITQLRQDLLMLGEGL